MMKNAKQLILLCALMMFAVTLFAQDSDPAAMLRHPRWTAAVYAGGGNGLEDQTNVHFVRVGGRISRVLIPEIGSGRLQSSIEYGWEVNPVDYVLWGGYKSVYGFSISPLLLKWNFTAPKRTVPFILVTGTYLHTSENIPPGDTAQHNFLSGVGIGMNHFVNANHAVTWDVRAVHLSNASIGNHNPGVNVALQFTMGYTWFKK